MAELQSPTEAPVSYEAAQQELAELLHALQQDEADLDAMTARVARARILIDWSRERLRSVEVEVDRLLGSVGEV